MPRKPIYPDEVVLAACDDWDARTTQKTLAKKYGIKPTDMNYLINVLGKKIRKKYAKGNLQSSQISNVTFYDSGEGANGRNGCI